MYTAVIYTVILHILHSLYEIGRLICNVCTYFVKLWFTDDIERLSKEIRNLKKRPHHLVFMLGNEEPSFKDLANIVLWSATAGIPIISFYEHNGILKQSKSRLYKVLSENNIKFTSDSTIKQQNGHKNGFSHPPIRVNVISLQDGQTRVAELTKECIVNNVKEIEIEYIDKELRKKFGELPDPELALYCGRICSTFGILPWQIRLTEFIDIITHHGICLSNFLLALKRYEKSEQRFGK